MLQPNVTTPAKTGASVSHPWEKMRKTIWTVQAYSLAVITFMSFFPPWFHMQEYLFFGMFTAALATAWSERRNPLIRTPIDVPLGLFIGWVLITVPFATDSAYSFTEWRKFCAHVLVFYWATLVLNVNSEREVSKYVMWAVVVGSGVLSAYALTDFVARGGTWRDRWVRASAPSSDYNWLSTYMVITIPILIVTMVNFPLRWMRAVIGIATGLALAAQTFSYTRAGWLAHVAEGIGYGLLSGRRRLAMWILVAAALGVLGILVVSKAGFHRDTVDPWTLGTRVVVWELGLREITNHPLVGIGYGNDTFVKRYPQYSSDAQLALSQREAVLPAMHNTFLMVALGSGVPGVVIFLWMFGRIISTLAKDARHSQLYKARPLMIGIAVAILGFAVRNFFDYMFAGSLAYLFWIIAATGLIKTCRGSASEYSS